MIINFKQFEKIQLSAQKDYTIEDFYQFFGSNMSKDEVDKILCGIIEEYKLDVDTTDLRLLGNGMYGFAFLLSNPKIGKSVVMKITTDNNEYQNAIKIVGERPKFIAHHYDARVLGVKMKDELIELLNKSDKKYYVILLEKLQTFEDEELSDITEIISWYKEYKTNADDNVEDQLHLRVLSVDTDINYIHDLSNMESECHEYGIPFTDIHSENVGLKNSNIARFDIGWDAYDYYEYDLEPIKINIQP